MALFSICFVLGVLAFHQLAWLPGWPWACVAAGTCALLLRLRRLWPVAVILLGFVWSHAYALLTFPPYLPGIGETASDLIVRGRIVSLAQQSNGTARFVFEAASIEGEAQTLDGAWRLRLAPPSG